MLTTLETKRLKISQATANKRKSKFGQFLTPQRIAQFMASLFHNNAIDQTCKLLDAGAGIGSLSVAFLQRWQDESLNFPEVQLTAYELDPALIPELKTTLSSYAATIETDKHKLGIHIYSEDFILQSIKFLSKDLFSQNSARNYTHAILNPPYKKIHSNSVHRIALRQTAIETVNLYSAFVALALKQLCQGGQLVAIIPRSFCNGPYYKPFRQLLLKYSSIQQIHLFESRNKAFRDDGVLQENLIIHLKRGLPQGSVVISSSTDDSFTDLVSYSYPFKQIVYPNDTECFIHIPILGSQSADSLQRIEIATHSLNELGLMISTGPVVDFRLKEQLFDQPAADTVPLLYPCHFQSQVLNWPIQNGKKPNAIACNSNTQKWLYPTGFYCVTRRFSAKEEKRRIIASIVDPEHFSGYSMLGFENHLNVFHQNRHGLPETVARGLAVYLSSSAVDECFRLFSGHTQVNATDLKQMKYPKMSILIGLGNWAMRQEHITQEEIDQKIGSMT